MGTNRFNFETASDEAKQDLGELLIEAALGPGRLLILGESLTWDELLERTKGHRRPDGVLEDAKIDRNVIYDIEPNQYGFLVRRDGPAARGLVPGRNCEIGINVLCMRGTPDPIPTPLEVEETLRNNPQLEHEILCRHSQK